MRFLPFINGKEFLFLYIMFAAIALIYILSKLNNYDDKNYIIAPLDEDKYYVLKNEYNLKDMFYYFTYKLYARGVLIKDEEDKCFYVNKDVQIYLSDVEQQVYNLYLEKFAPKDFKESMVVESYFKLYYENISSDLKTDGLLTNSEIIKNKKKFANLSLIIILIPGIWRFVGGIASGMPVNVLFMEIVIIIILAKIFFAQPINQRLTCKGRASMNSFEKHYESMKNETKESDDYNYNYLMYGFLLGSTWEYFLGVETLRQSAAVSNNDFDIYNSSCSSCSSDSSNTSDSSGGSSCSSCSSDSSSGSSCSSCSSCGGCGGGD
ncbi:hypothetical protein [Clostridium sp. C2-6-12]|uniref:hypothetical protein n=1 Tax=Clostridium sp. C2-6-12 TaxID=2698832 RepID=UPI00136AB3C6|nr:hypothetical protein [Clostridium sp. C2-6-12]